MPSGARSKCSLWGKFTELAHQLQPSKEGTVLWMARLIKHFLRVILSPLSKKDSVSEKYVSSSNFHGSPSGVCSSNQKELFWRVYDKEASQVMQGKKGQGVMGIGSCLSLIPNDSRISMTGTFSRKNSELEFISGMTENPNVIKGRQGQVRKNDELPTISMT